MDRGNGPWINQLVSDSETSYEYDLNGNLIRVIGSAQSALYEYNAENKLVRATVQNGVLITEESYTYDYQGNRTSKTTHRSDGVTEYVKYINDNSSLTNVLAEIGSEGSVQAYYTIGADLISQERDGKVSVFLYDGHGYVVGLANESGVVTDTYSYDAFGNLLDSTGFTKNYYRYCGEQFDETTGLYYLRARYMDTSTGRFISQDSYEGSISDPVSLHKYLYANSNPVTYSDPSGYMSMAGLAVRGAVIGALSGLIVPNAVSIIRNLVTTGEFKSDLSPMQNLANILNGVIFGALFGICAATFIAYGIIAGVAVSINFSLAYGCYIDGQNAAAAGQWDIAICSWFFALFYLIAGFTTISLASNLDYSNTNQNNSNTNSNDSNANDRVNNDKIVESANKPHKGGETIAGHALQKHAGRHPEIWGRIKGGSDEINETALKHLNEILDAEGEFTVNQAPNGAYFLEKTLPDGRGVRINMDGTFKGFIDQ